MARSRSRSTVLAAALAAAAMALVLSSNSVRADVVLNTPGTYAGDYLSNAAIRAFTSQADIAAFMAANGGTLASLQAATDAPVAFSPVTVTGPFPIPPWFANGPNSSWIGPTSTGGSTAALAPFVSPGYIPLISAPQGFFTYATSFTLTGAPASVSGLQWSSDNNGVAIYVNGKNEGDQDPGDFTKFVPFTLNTADFVAGVNTVTFVVFNEEFSAVHASPTGLRVEGTLIQVPEPGMMTLAAVGALPILGLYWARRRRAQA